MKYLSLIILGFLLVALQPAMADDDETKDPTGVVTLLCKMSRHSQVLTQTLSVDYDKKLVNGISANFTPSMISWNVENGSKSEHHELNRVTGYYYSWGDSDASTEPMPAFTCEIAPKKF
jgi:phospholipase C